MGDFRVDYEAFLRAWERWITRVREVQERAKKEVVAKETHPGAPLAVTGAEELVQAGQRLAATYEEIVRRHNDAVADTDTKKIELLEKAERHYAATLCLLTEKSKRELQGCEQRSQRLRRLKTRLEDANRTLRRQVEGASGGAKKVEDFVRALLSN